METSGSLSKSMTLTAMASYRGRNSSRWRNANSSMKWFQFCDLRCCRWWWATTWRRSSCTAWWTGELTLDICLLSRKSPSSGRSRTPTRTWTGGLVSRSSRASSASWAGRSPRRWWCKCDQAIEGVVEKRASILNSNIKKKTVWVELSWAMLDDHF